MKNDIDINKIVVSNKLPFRKHDLKQFIGYKDSEKLDLHENSVHKWLYIKGIAMKMESSISWNIRNFFGVSVSQNIRTALFWESIRTRKFYS